MRARVCRPCVRFVGAKGWAAPDLVTEFIPHARYQGATDAIGAFMRLDEPVDFDAMDREPVDLVFGLLVPENCTDEHIQILAQLAELFRIKNYDPH